MPASVIPGCLSLVPVMNYLYSLYDALVSIKQEMASVRTELKQEIESRYTLLDQKIDTLRGDMTRDLAAFDLRLTIKLGSMLFVGFGLTIAAMRLWV
jgi:hypothetical protein